jgi:hypothetical protein
VGLNTWSKAMNGAPPPAWPEPPVWSHCYAVVAADLVKGIATLRNPWHAGLPFTIPITDINGNYFSSVDAGTLPAELRLQAPAAPVSPAVVPGGVPLGSYSRAQILAAGWFAKGEGGYPNTLGMAPTSAITIPVSGIVNVTVSIQQPAGVVVLNGQPIAAVNSVATFKGVTGPLVFTGKGGWYDVMGIAIASASTGPATLYTVAVTAPGATPQTFSATKITAVLADGTTRTIPEAA